MPELPEVETVVKGLEPFVAGAKIKQVKTNRKNLRFDFPRNFISTLVGQEITSISRRAKYLIFALGNEKNLLSHLGMSGNFTILDVEADISEIKHLHVEFLLNDKQGKSFRLIYTDPRRFGFMDIFTHQKDCQFLKNLGVEPFGNLFNAQYMANIFKNKRTPIKTALLDQTIIAGLGNIYVCEALWQAKIHPKTSVNMLVDEQGQALLRLEKLTIAIRTILNAAIKAGGSTLNDFHSVKGQSGYFQHNFDVYGREDELCNRKNCGAKISKISQSGRSTFFCPSCQKQSI